MAPSQADWELDKVEMEWSRLVKQTGMCTLAEWRELCKVQPPGLEAMATSWVSKPFHLKLPCRGTGPNRQNQGCWLLCFSL